MGLFGRKSKDAKLQKQYQAKMKEAMEAQRNGDIQKYAALYEEAQEILKQKED